MDLVINHSYGNSPFYRLYNDGRPTEQSPWFNRNHNFANTAAHWGYDWNHESVYTKKLFKRAISFWMNEFKIDGFRSNVADSVFNSANAPTQAEVDAAPEVEPEDDYNPEPPEVETPAVGEVPTA